MISFTNSNLVYPRDDSSMDTSLNNSELSTVENEEDARKKRIKYLKTILKIYQGCVISQLANHDLYSTYAEIDEDLLNHDFLHEKVIELHNNVNRLNQLQKCIDCIYNGISHLELDVTDDENFKREVIEAVKGVSYFTRTIIKLRTESCDETASMMKRKEYIMHRNNFQNELQEMKKKSYESIPDKDVKSFERTLRYMEKINVIRKMKALLVGNFGCDHNNGERLQKYRTSFYRNLTIDDFKETWNVGIDDDKK